MRTGEDECDPALIRRRSMLRLRSLFTRTAVTVGFSVLSALAGVVAAAESGGTTLGIDGRHFTLNGKPTFLLGFSYYGALGAPEEFIRKDLKEFRRHGFNWLRVWATWGGFDTNISAVNAQGLPREKFLDRLQRLVAECDRLGMVVDVTLNRGHELPDFEAHQRAVETLVKALQAHRNWYLDLGNERDVRDARYVSADELKQLRQQVRVLDEQCLVTASLGGHDLDTKDVSEALLTIGLDFLCPHRPRHAKSPAETAAQTRISLDMIKQTGRSVPVQYQEPFRRGYTQWEPTAEDFLTDLRGAIAGGAAGWCFHNGSQRATPDEQPRRSFDLRTMPLIDQLDPVERKVITGVEAVLAEAKSKN